MSLNRSKTDSVLGQQVHDYLVKKGVETPTVPNSYTTQQKIDQIEHHFSCIMGTLGLDLDDDSLLETPTRFAKMLVNETMWGLDYDLFPKCTTVENKMGYDEMIVERDIKVSSNCEHHFVTIKGVAHIAYIPDKKVLGLSKLPRIVEYFSKRPQIQERLTEQVFYALEYVLNTSNIAVTIQAEHMCVSQRGVEDQTANTITSKLGGRFKTDPSARAEYLKHVYG